MLNNAFIVVGFIALAIVANSLFGDLCKTADKCNPYKVCANVLGK